jgi:transcription termination/antitermination protein NusA
VLAGYGLSVEQGQEIIMAARQAAGWFGDEEVTEATEDASEEAEA